MRFQPLLFDAILVLSIVFPGCGKSDEDERTGNCDATSAGCPLWTEAVVSKSAQEYCQQQGQFGYDDDSASAEGFCVSEGTCIAYCSNPDPCRCGAVKVTWAERQCSPCSDAEPPCTCTPGDTQACACDNEEAGEQTCSDDCAWGECECVTDPYGSVSLCEDVDLVGRALVVGMGEDIPDMSTVVTGGQTGFNDTASSAQFFVSPGWRVTLYDDINYGGEAYRIEGGGLIMDFGAFSDKCSSLRWEQQ